MPSIAALLENVSKGLLFPSESDIPFEVVTWKNVNGELTPAKLLVLAGQDPKSPVEEISMDDFFAELTADQDEQGPEEDANISRFRKLRQTIEENLTAVRVFRIGKMEVLVYVIGKTPTEGWVGLKTVSVET